MKRKDREIERAEAEAILEKGLYGVLSLNGAAGPYGVPICHALLNGLVYFHCAVKGRKVDLLRADDKVSFCVLAEAEPLPAAFSMKYRSAIVSGKAAEVTGRAEKLEALRKGLPAALDALHEPDAWSAIRLTLITAAVAVPLNLVFGVAAAWAVAKYEFKGKAFLIYWSWDGERHWLRWWRLANYIP